MLFPTFLNTLCLQTHNIIINCSYAIVNPLFEIIWFYILFDNLFHLVFYSFCRCVRIIAGYLIGCITNLTRKADTFLYRLFFIVLYYIFLFNHILCFSLKREDSLRIMVLKYQMMVELMGMDIIQTMMISEQPEL